MLSGPRPTVGLHVDMLLKCAQAVDRFFDRLLKRVERLSGCIFQCPTKIHAISSRNQLILNNELLTCC